MPEHTHQGWLFRSELQKGDRIYQFILILDTNNGSKNELAQRPVQDLCLKTHVQSSAAYQGREGYTWIRYLTYIRCRIREHQIC